MLCFCRTYGGGFIGGGSLLDDGSLIVAQSVKRVRLEFFLFC